MTATTASPATSAPAATTTAPAPTTSSSEATTSTTDAGTATTAGPGPAPPGQPPGDLGDDPRLDALAGSCFDGDFSACDQLFFNSPANSPYEAYGDSCGGRNQPGALCVNIYSQNGNG